MSIILAGIGTAGEQLSERPFEQDVIVIGRDARSCDVAFDKDRFPMVSRRHAELRRDGAKWLIADLDSTYGTYVGGRPVTRPTQVSAGDEIQLGTGGPLLRVVWFEASSATAAEGILRRADKNVREAAVEDNRPTVAVLDFVDSSRPDVTISKNLIWLGRESGCDIVFDASAATVSRKHAFIEFSGGEYFITDNNSFNGTLVNERRITSAARLFDNDRIRLGVGGPLIRIVFPIAIRSAEAGTVRGTSPVHDADRAEKTVILTLNDLADRKPGVESSARLSASVAFAERRELIVGRGEACDVRLDGLQISKQHARLLVSGAGVVIEDLNSTNGVFVNGERTPRAVIGVSDAAQIGPFILKTGLGGNIDVFDTRSMTRIDAVGLIQDAKNGAVRGTVRLLDRISLSIRPNEFIGILGPSGSGKSTLIETMNGFRPASSGGVFVNNLDLYSNFDSLKHQIGYVPQDDVIHRELSVRKTLYYVARLRLSSDVSATEISQIIDEVLDMVGLAGQKDVAVNRLSGGQRKRVSIAVELLTKPSVIYLDEPTSGLDPFTGEKMMRLFREISVSGRTVVMTTHAMENVRLFDKIVLLVGGKLVFYGPPDDALEHFGVPDFRQLYDRIEESVGSGEETAADEFRRSFEASAHFDRNVREPLNDRRPPQSAKPAIRRGLGSAAAVRQWLTLSHRYANVLFKDKLNLVILFAQAPLIALLTYLVVGSRQPRDFVYFVIALVSFWFGISIAAREIVRERAVYGRERMFNLGITPYLFSKLTVLGLIVAVQCMLLFLPLKLLDAAGLMSVPGEMLGLPQFWIMLLTAGVGIAWGLFISAVVRTPEIATSVIPLVLIPQILFSGIVGVPQGIGKVVGLSMPSAWSFDTIKRFSTLDTLEPEGADPNGGTKGLGVYKSIEAENEKALSDARQDLEALRKAVVEDGGLRSVPEPKMPDIKKIPENLSGYVSFFHPWMNEVLNQAVLMIMLVVFAAAALAVLWLRDYFR